MSEMSENVRKCPKNKMSEMSDIPKNVKSDMDIFGHFRTFSDIFKIFLPWFNQTIIMITVNIQSKVTEFKCIIHYTTIILLKWLILHS